MPRARNGVAHHKRVKKVLKLAKGFRGRRSKLYHSAKDAVMRSLSYAYRDRRQKKRELRRLWVVRLNAAVREHDISYSKFIDGLVRSDIRINRQLLSNLSIEDPVAFREVVLIAKGSVGV